VLDGLRGEASIAELCRREGIAESLYCAWSKEFLEAGNEGRAGLAGHRHGSRTRSLTGTFGPIEIAVPRARLNIPEGQTTEWKSQALRAYQRRTLAADAPTWRRVRVTLSRPIDHGQIGRLSAGLGRLMGNYLDEGSILLG
jgi:transposase-like protein